MRTIIEIAILIIFLITIPIVILLERNVSVESGESAFDHIQRGDQLYKMGRAKFNDASVQYWEAIKRDPNAVDARFKLAEIFYEYIWNYEALHELFEIEKINPNYPGLYLLMGKVYHRMGETDKAFSAFQRAITLGQESSEAYYYLGTIYQQKDLAESAIKAYEKAISAPLWDRSASVKSYLQLGRVYKVKKDTDKAEDALKKALNIEPGNLEVISELKGLYRQSAEDYKSKGNFDESAKRFEEILKIDPDNPDNVDVYMELGSIYRSKELYDKAIAIYTAVTRLDPMNFDAFSALKELKMLKAGSNKGEQ